MRRLLKILILALPLAVAYLAWPVFAALEIREAIVAGDTADAQPQDRLGGAARIAEGVDLGRNHRQADGRP